MLRTSVCSSGVRLDAIEARVVGALVEKELSTPQQYPLTLNALVLACNQSSNREPVVTYDEPTVEAALARLRQQRLVRFVHPSHGRSVVRYRLVLDEVLGLDERQRALLGVLLLRGPQTLGELRLRTARLASFADLDDVEKELTALGRLGPPLAARLERQPGQKEDRYTQLLVPEDVRAGRPSAGEPVTREAPDPEGRSPARASTLITEEPPGPAGEAAGNDLEELRVLLAQLTKTVAELRSDFDSLRNSLGG